MVAAFAAFWLWRSMDELLALGMAPVKSAITAAGELWATSLLVVSASLVLIAAADVPFQLHSYRKKLRMTRTEVRDELKETEGRPEVKSRIRLLQQQAATRRMMQDVPAADVVVTNPTHFAVALKYDEHRMGAPRVVAKGRELVVEPAPLLPSLRVVAQDSRDPPGLRPAGLVEQRHGERDREGAPVAVRRRDFEECGSVAGLAGCHDLPVAGPVPVSEPFRDDEVEGLSDRLDR